MQLAVRAKLYPTLSQKVYLERMFGASRFIYNWGLQRKTEQFALIGKSEGFYALCKALTSLKKDPNYAFLNEVPLVPLQTSLQNLESAYTSFFKKKARHPVFKSKRDNFQSARYVGNSYKVTGNRLGLARLPSRIKLRFCKPLSSAPSSCVISKECDGSFWASFVCEAKCTALPMVEKSVGLDMGLADFIVTSDGVRHKLPKQIKQRIHLKRLQRLVSRKQKDSNNRNKSRVKLARCYSKIQNVKRDFLHKTSKQLVVENQDIAMEDLTVKNMVKNRRLARPISESSWREFRTMVEYKSRLYGRNFMLVDKFFPSTKTCHGCGNVLNKLPLNVRQWVCPKCSLEHDRDVNAAINILAAGYAVSACGVDGRPVAGYSRKRHSTMKQELSTVKTIEG